MVTWMCELYLLSLTVGFDLVVCLFCVMLQIPQEPVVMPALPSTSACGLQFMEPHAYGVAGRQMVRLGACGTRRFNSPTSLCVCVCVRAWVGGWVR